jgi:hypothetical protein
MKAALLGRLQNKPSGPQSRLLRRQIRALDLVMEMIVPEFDASTIRPVQRKEPRTPGTIMRPILNILREAGKPMSREAICDAFCARIGRQEERWRRKAHHCLMYMRRQKLVESFKEDRVEYWQIGNANQAASRKVLSLDDFRPRKE